MTGTPCADLSKLEAKLESNTNDISAMSKQLYSLTATIAEHTKEQETKLTALTDKISPLYDILEDVAAVGRAGKVIKRIVSWFVLVGGAFYFLIHWVEGIVRIK